MSKFDYKKTLMDVGKDGAIIGGTIVGSGQNNVRSSVMAGQIRIMTGQKTL